MIVVLTVLVIVFAPVGAISANPTLFEIGVKNFVHLMAEGCGAGWHWSNRRGWDWGRCALDWRPD
jgi:hypothetical protein